MTTRKRHTPEQVVRKLAQADRMLGEGRDIADVCRELGVSEQTYYRWRNQFGGLKADDAKRLKDLENENSMSLANVMGPPCCPGVLGIDATGHATGSPPCIQSLRRCSRPAWRVLPSSRPATFS